MNLRNDNVVKPATRWIAVVAVGAMLLTGCGAGGDESGTPDSTDSSGGDLGTLEVIRTNEKEFSTGVPDFAEAWDTWPAGLTVNSTVGGAVTQALATGDVQVGLTSPTRVIPAILQGLDVSIVGNLENEWDQQIIVSKDFPAESIDDLQYANWGISNFGSAGEVSVRSIAEAEGWAKDDYTVTTLSDINGLIAGLQNGTIDAFTWGAFAPFQLEETGEAKLLGFVGDIIGPLPTSVIAVSNQALEQNPEVIKAFCEGVYETHSQMIAEPDRTTEQLIEWGNSEFVANGMVETELEMVATDSSISDEQFQLMVDATRVTAPDAAELDLEGIKEFYKSCDDL